MSKYRLFHGDCLEIMPMLESDSVNMVLCDLPYGTTACHWDSVIPFEPLWAQYKRIIKPRGAIVLFGSQPFTSALITSNVEWFKYEWIWLKNQSTQMMNARYRPLMQHENILVFSPTRLRSNQFVTDKMTYNPQCVVNISEVAKGKSTPTAINNMRGNINRNYLKTITGFPKTILNFNVEVGLHPTQKPVALLAYLIRTYTNTGETVLDNTMGSGSTIVAAIQEGRNAIGIENDYAYFGIAKDRILKATYQPTLFAQPTEQYQTAAMFGDD